MTTLKTDLTRAFAGYSFHSWRCTGSHCEFKIAWVQDGCTVMGSCPDPHCRGSLVPSYRISNERVITMIINTVEHRREQSKLPFDPQNLRAKGHSDASSQALHGITPPSSPEASEASA